MMDLALPRSLYLHVSQVPSLCFLHPSCCSPYKNKCEFLGISVVANSCMASAACVVYFVLSTCCPAKVSCLFTRNSAGNEIPVQLAVAESAVSATPYGEETASKQVTFREPLSNSEMEDPESEGNQNERETSANWSSGNSPYANTVDDPGSSYSPYLPPVLEEPSSSFSEGNFYFTSSPIVWSLRCCQLFEIDEISTMQLLMMIHYQQ